MSWLSSNLLRLLSPASLPPNKCTAVHCTVITHSKDLVLRPEPITSEYLLLCLVMDDAEGGWI